MRHRLEPPAHHSAWVDVDLDALAYNYSYISDKITPAKLIAVVKAYGLGTGILLTSRKLESLGVPMLSVSNFHEALYLRKHGIESPILLMNGLLPSQMQIAIQLDLDFFGFDEQAIRTANDIGQQLKKRARVHIKIDAGLGRLGILPDQADSMRSLLPKMHWVQVMGIASHVASPSRKEHDHLTRIQYEQFLSACRVLDPDHNLLWHFSSSNVVPRLPEVNADAVRCEALVWGLAHYWPLPWPVKPVASYKSRLVQVKDIPAGHNVGYNFKHSVLRPTRLGIVPIGTVDGLKSQHADGGSVLIRGKSCPILGMCSCEMMVDVTDAGAAQVEDEVVLIGGQAGLEQTAVEFGLAGASSFMGVLASISPRIPRVYWENGECKHIEVFCSEEDWQL